MTEGRRTSVIIPVRNGEKYLKQAIVSVLDQLLAGDQLIVVDNDSNDASYSISAQFQPRVTLLTCKTIGPSAARNEGLKRATGDYIAFLDHDDLWPAGRHSALMQALANNPSADAATGRILIHYEGSGSSNSFSRLHGKIAPDISLMPSLFRRGIIDRVGFFLEELKRGEDTHYLVRLRHEGIRFAACDIDALIYRRHDRNSTRDPRQMQEGLFDVIRLNLARKRARPGI